MTSPSSGPYFNSFANANFYGNPYSINLSHESEPDHYYLGQNVSSNVITDTVEMEINEEHGTKYEWNCSGVQIANIKINSRKRRSFYENEAPLCKRKMEKVSARLENFHISSDPGPSLLDRKESDSEVTDEEDIEKDDGLLILDERLRKYIEQERKASPIISNPLSMALVPYVPPISYDNPAMTGRIKEINNEEAVGYVSNDNGYVTFPDDAYTINSEHCLNETTQSTELLSSTMNDIETDTYIQNDATMEIDSF